MKYNKSFFLLFIVATFLLFLILGLVLIALNYKSLLQAIKHELNIDEFKTIEKFEDAKESSSEKLVKSLQKTIRVANTVGRRMLSPQMWSERLQLINKSPMDLARMHIAQNNIAQNHIVKTM
jgi:hypothetical protein